MNLCRAACRLALLGRRCRCRLRCCRRRCACGCTFTRFLVAAVDGCEVDVDRAEVEGLVCREGEELAELGIGDDYFAVKASFLGGIGLVEAVGLDIIIDGTRELSAAHEFRFGDRYTYILEESFGLRGERNGLEDTAVDYRLAGLLLGRLLAHRLVVGTAYLDKHCTERKGALAEIFIMFLHRFHEFIKCYFLRFFCIILFFMIFDDWLRLGFRLELRFGLGGFTRYFG